MVTIRQQSPHIGLSRRVSIHVEVHGWSYEHRSLHRQICSDEHIVSHTVRHLAHSAGSTRSYHHCISPQSEVYMRVPRAVALREELAHHGLVCQSRQRNGSDKLLTGRCYHHLHLSSLLYKFAYQQTRLIGGYRACYAQYYFLAL